MPRMSVQLARRGDFADKVFSALRYEFGGHLEKPTSGVA